MLFLPVFALYDVNKILKVYTWSCVINTAQTVQEHRQG